MKRKTLVLLLCLTLVSSLPALAANSPKAGSACKKEGQTRSAKALTFTCTKVGSRLVWSKGARSKIPGPTPRPVTTPDTTQTQVAPTPSPAQSAVPSPTPTVVLAKFEPWSSNFSTSALVDAALEATSKFFGQVTPDNSYEITVDPKMTSSDREWITRALDYAHGSFRSIDQQRMKVFLATNHEWARDTLRSQNTWIGDPGAPFPCSQGQYDAYCADRNMVMLTFVDVYRSGYRWDVGRLSTPAHEVFHVVQHALWGSNYAPDDPRYVPVWLKEGSANFYGYFVINQLKLDSYTNGRSQQVATNPAYRVSIPLKSYQGYGGMQDGISLDPYGIGQAATEYLVASSGFESLLNIFRFTKSEGSFEKGFEKAVGVSLSDFYSRFEAARPSMQIGR